MTESNKLTRNTAAGLALKRPPGAAPTPPSLLCPGPELGALRRWFWAWKPTPQKAGAPVLHGPHSLCGRFWASPPHRSASPGRGLCPLLCDLSFCWVLVRSVLTPACLFLDQTPGTQRLGPLHRLDCSWLRMYNNG